MIDDICSKNVFLVARFILAEEYSVQYETIYDNLLPIHKKLKEIYSNIPRSETFINDLINKGIEKKLKKNNFKKE